MYRRCWGAQLVNPWQCRTPDQGCAGCGARNRNGPTGGLA
ncbi:putative carboxylesterase domain protein [Mycobacterium kansasii]|uniref:Putative carboxylesterase domain protein n=1 Tax=Mycobacterium kansasii TaxID=1768 RepID=A0A1V3WC91_MYCKA|nr:putative carboxylesterase domain protein [Mycobacterium kansasii]OOK74023.1 putative carboxylesterase domain protein [Mycobacterium kansasii]